mgnify:CR=1 FL=1
MSNKKTILAISGSTKESSTNTTILKAIKTRYADQFDVHIYDQLTELPYFNPDLDLEPFPQSVLRFRQLIESADGVLFCTPEYVFSLPGILKNAIEWTVSTTVFSDKPVAIITAATSGKKAHESLHLVMTTIMANIAPEAHFLIQAPKTKLNAQGEISDPATLAKMDTLIQALLTTINHQEHATKSTLSN